MRTNTTIGYSSSAARIGWLVTKRKRALQQLLAHAQTRERVLAEEVAQAWAHWQAILNAQQSYEAHQSMSLPRRRATASAICQHYGHRQWCEKQMEQLAEQAAAAQRRWREQKAALVSAGQKRRVLERVVERLQLAQIYKLSWQEQERTDQYMQVAHHRQAQDLRNVY